MLTIIFPSSDILLHTLAKLIAFPTVPNDSHREEFVLPALASTRLSLSDVDRSSFSFSCRQGAIFLKRTLNQLGAESALLSGAVGKNPLVLATFKGRDVPGKKKKRVLFYGVSSFHTYSMYRRLILICFNFLSTTTSSLRTLKSGLLIHGNSSDGMGELDLCNPFTSLSVL